MHEKSSSVFSLIHELCENIVANGCEAQNEHNRLVQKCRSNSFGILLRKTQDYDTTNNFDSFKELNYKLFAEKLTSNMIHNELSRSSMFEDLLDHVSKDPYFAESPGKDIIHFLFLLQNDIKQCSTDSRPLSLLVPGAFTLHAKCMRNQYYPESTNSLYSSRLKFLKNFDIINSELNPFPPRYGAETSFIKFRQLSNNASNFCSIARSENITVKFTNRLCERTTWKRIESFRILERKTIKQAKAKKCMGTDNNSISIKKDDECIDFQNCTFSWNWENLNRLGTIREHAFVGESNFILDVQSIHNNSVGLLNSIKVIPEKLFLNDIKSLTAGIQSDSFILNESNQFFMLPNLTVDGISPITIQNYVMDFLECGTCYKRLQTFISKTNSLAKCHGFISKTLWNAVDEYITTFRQLVFSFPDDDLIQFFKRMKRMMKQISNLSYTLAVHPNVEVSIKPPMGSQFLGFLYREIMRLTEMDFITLLIYLLKRCCNVYLRHLQKWIFYGILDDSSNELFICFVDHYREKTKHFYDKAYYVRRESVPGFFQTFEDQILLCGKYAMLLKAFVPNHPLFNLHYPPISVCLSVEELQQMKQSCQNYHERARKVCGNPVTIRDILNKKLELKKKFYDMASERSSINLKKWQEEQHIIATANAEIKRKRHEELTTQLVDIKNRKISERRANVESELKYLKSIREKNDKRLCLDNINLTKRIEYYQELSDIMTEEINLISKNKSSHRSETIDIILPVISITEENDNLNKNKISTTPASTADTDFESCFDDDDDSESIYTECISEDFVMKFQETANELKKCFDNENEISEPCFEMKKSLSDILNVNELPTDREKNREKNMSGRNVENCTSTASMETLAVNICNTPRIIVDQKHHFKNTTTELEYFAEDKTIDVNSNPIEKLSNLQRNRIRMMHSNQFGEDHESTLSFVPKREELNLDLTSDLSRNRKRVLGSEYFSSFKIQSTDNIILTPMSTTSDISVQTKEDINVDNNSNIKSPSKKNIDTPVTMLGTCNSIEDSECTMTLEIENDILNGNKCIEEVTFTEFELENHADYDNDDYKRCIDLVKSNFKCNTATPYIRLNSTNSSENYERITSNYVQLNSMSVISLTEFLKKSISIPINTHLEIVNNEVMRLFLKDLKILEHFKSLRNYFFLMDGEFGSIICEGIIEKLEKGATPEKLLNYQMLHSILDTAVGSSILSKERNSENLSFIVSDLPATFDLSSPSVLSNLSLSYRISWPLTIVLNPESLDQYANIFKYLIKVRRISWVLEESYQMLKGTVKKYGRPVLQSPQYRHVQQIRHKFYHFVRALENHITSNALQASWKTFKDDLLNVQTIEDMYRKHANYIKRIMFLCMLNRQSIEFYKTIENIFRISLRFYRNLKSKKFKLDRNGKYFTHSLYEKLMADELDLDKFIRYTIYLGNKIVRHGYQEEIGEFINLINYNQYYLSESKTADV